MSARARKELRAAWEQVRRDFFPRWDRAGLWRVQLGSPGKTHGKCDPVRRLIRIGVLHSDQDDRDRLFIHEICHAVATGSHGEPWLRRMEAACRRAEALGRARLAERLREEVEMYRATPVVTAAQVYQELGDVGLLQPDVPFRKALKFVAWDNGMTVAEFRKAYRLARRVHAKARAEGLAERELRRRFVPEENP